MGPSNSLQEISHFQKEYLKQEIYKHPYFGHHHLLTNRNRREMIICKQMILHSSEEATHFWHQYQKIQKKPFGIIYPRAILKNDNVQTCSSISEINIYLDLVGKNLSKVIKQQGCFSENKTWFLLSQLSKSLQLLGQKDRPHWAISPDNIYQNQYQNYFIYDNLFVLGIDPQNYLMKKLENQELMSSKMEIILSKGNLVPTFEGFQEDSYCLGFVLLFVLTAVHPNSLPRSYTERHQAIKLLLQQLRGTIGQELIHIIFSLTQRDPKQRLDNYQLRKIIKDMEMDIIHNQSQDYRKTSRKQFQSQQINIQSTRKYIKKNVYQPSNKPLQHDPNDPRHYKKPNTFEPQFINPNPNQLQKPNFSHFYQIGEAQKLKNLRLIPINPISYQVRQSQHSSDRSHQLTRINSNNQLMLKK